MTRIVISQPVRKKRLGAFDVIVGSVDGHRVVIVQHDTLGACVEHFVRKPHEADLLFDEMQCEDDARARLAAGKSS